MDRARFSTIAHRDHVYCNPIGVEKIDRVLPLLDLSVGARVLDVGCGKGELLVRIAERFGAAGVGVDPNAEFLAEARTRAAARAPHANLEFLETEFAGYATGPDSFDAAVCIGASHACGGYRPTLRALRRLVKPGGHVLVGEGYWRGEPAVAYLRALEATREEFTDHAGNVTAGIDEGLLPMYAAASSQDEWDHYEGLYARAIERYVQAHPEDPDAPAMTRRIRDWRRNYLEHGRDTLGFGLYLFAKERA